MQEDPFAAFKPSEPKTPIEKIPVEKKKRGRKAKQKAKLPAGMLPAESPAGDGSIMVPIGAIDACRHLTDDELKFTIAMAGGISELSKFAQKHVVTALAKIFS